MKLLIKDGDKLCVIEGFIYLCLVIFLTIEYVQLVDFSLFDFIFYELLFTFFEFMIPIFLSFQGIELI